MDNSVMDGGKWWSVCLPLLISTCSIESRSSLLAPAHPDGPGKRAVIRLWCGGGKYCILTLTWTNFLNLQRDVVVNWWWNVVQCFLWNTCAFIVCCPEIFWYTSVIESSCAGCRWNCRTLGSAHKWRQSCRSVSRWLALRTGWLRKSSQDYRTIWR